MSNLSLTTVEKLISRNLPYIDVSPLDHLLLKELSHMKNPEEPRVIRENLINSFRKNLDKDTVAYIRDQLFKVKATRTDELDSDQLSLSLLEDASILDLHLNFSKEWRSHCLEVKCPHSSSTYSVPPKRVLSAIPSCLSYPFFSFPSSSTSFQEENEDILSIVPSSIPSFEIPWERAIGSKDEFSDMDSIQFSKYPSNRYNCSVLFVKTRKIDRLFSFLMSHLLINTPCDPVRFLMKLIDSLIGCRDEGEAPPLLHGKEQLDALFACMDPSGLGYISLKQYRVAMKTLGVTMKKPVPSHVECHERVPFDVFREDARKYMAQTLMDEILRPSLKKKQ